MKIFLSYCHKNRAEADHIDQVLQSADYIIMRDIREVSYVGMGKTTFTYHLAGQLLKMNYLPLVFSCQEFEVVMPDTVYRLEKYFNDIYCDLTRGELKYAVIQNLLETQREKIIFLFDGLD